MIAWLKRSVAGIAVAVLAFLAYRAAQQVSGHKKAADRWKQIAVESDETAVAGSIVSAEAAITQAMKHEQEAKRIKLKAQERISKVAESDETIRDIVDRWRAG
jgi:hypothetical protein